MAEELKDKWKKVGKDWAALGTDLGKSLVSSMKAGVNAATEWAREEDKPKDEAEEPKAEEAKKEAEQKKEREKVGDFFFFVGGDGKDEYTDPAAKKRALYIEIVALVVLFVVFISIIIIRHRRDIVEYIKNIEGNDLDGD